MAGVDQADDLHALGQGGLRPGLQVVVHEGVFDAADGAFPACGVGGEEKLVVAAALISREVGGLGTVAGEGEDDDVAFGGGIGCGGEGVQDVGTDGLAGGGAFGQAGGVGGQDGDVRGGDTAGDKRLGHQAGVVRRAFEIGVEGEVVGDADHDGADFGLGLAGPGGLRQGRRRRARAWRQITPDGVWGKWGARG